MPNFSRCLSLALALAGVIASPLSQAQEQGLPVWELGAGVGGLFLPHYPGADQSHALILPFPLLIYRGESIRAERGGIRGIFYESENTVLDISIRGSLPVNSEDNRARQDMPDLDPTLEIGPQLSYTAWRQDHHRLQLRLPLRAVISFGDRIEHQGYVANPNLRWDWQVSGNFRMTTRASLRFGDGHWHDYFYAVDAAQMTANRPQYDAPGGYGGSSLSASFTYLHNDWRFGGGLGLEWLNNAAFADSPLVKDDESYFIGFAISKVLWKSQRRTQTRLESDGQ